MAELVGELESAADSCGMPSSWAPTPWQRARKLFAIFATTIMVLVIFNGLAGSAAAETLDLSSSSSGASANETIPGSEPLLTTLPDGSVQVQYTATFQRWDGVWRPMRVLNRSAGEWPYLVEETALDMRITRLGQSFTQVKPPNALYHFSQEGIKETFVLSSPPPSALVVLPFSATYRVELLGDSIALRDAAGRVVWRTGDWHAWDSSSSNKTWERPIASITYSDAVLRLTLDREMLSAATYPLYVDPTWTLSASAGWGASTFQDAVEDKGDHTINIGWLADNFNDNTNEQWTYEGGSVTFTQGVMKLSTSSAVRAGASWTDQHFGFKIRFTVSGGSAQAYFRFKDWGNYYRLDISEVLDSLALQKMIGGSYSVIGSRTQTIAKNTDYIVEIVALGNTFAIYWQQTGQPRVEWTLSDTSPPPSPISGWIRFTTNSVAKANFDNVRVWNTPSGTMTTPIRDSGLFPGGPLNASIQGTVDSLNQIHLRVRSSSNNVSWGPWTNLKANMRAGSLYDLPYQDRQRYYQLRVTLTSGVNETPALSELSTIEGTPTTSPKATTGFEPWHAYVGGFVNAVTGNVWHSMKDISVRGRGFTLAVDRSYNSLRGAETGPFGNGWTFAYNEKLVVNAGNSVTWSDGDGSQHTFQPKAASGTYDSPRGVPSRLVKNADNSFTLWHPDGSTQQFSSAGRLLSITDKNGNKLTLTWSGGKNPKLTSVSDDSGKSLTFTYDSSNRIIKVTDPMAREIRYAYDASNNLITVTDALNNVTTYSYASGKLSAIIDRIGKRTAFTYDDLGRAVEIWVGLYQGGSVVWQQRQYLIQYMSNTERWITNALGDQTHLYVNSFGNPTWIFGPSTCGRDGGCGGGACAGGGCGCCDHVGNDTKYAWDGEMNKIRTTDGRGFPWTMDFDYRSNLISHTDPGGNISSPAWTDVNTAAQYISLLLSETNFRGYTTKYTYDAKGNLVKTTNAKNDYAEYFYGSYGLLNWSKDFRGFKTWYEYNPTGYLTKVTDPLSQVTIYGYDAVGRMTSSTTPLGFVTTYQYDREDRLTKVTDPLGNFTTNTYNARGDLVASTDKNGFTTTFQVNVTNGKVHVQTDASGNTTRYSYDWRGNLLSVTDANSHITSYQYDDYDRLTKVTSPMNYLSTYAYDRAGNQIRRTDANGATTIFTYDGLNRVATVDYPAGSSPDLTFAYDKNGNPTVETGFGYTKWTGYDELDRVIWVNFNYGSFSKNTTYTYDANGNRKTMVDPELGTTSHDYDKANRPTKETDPEGRVYLSGFDKDSRPTYLKYPNGPNTTHSFDAASRLTKEVTNISGGATIESFEYTYDKAGSRLSVKLADGSVTSYEYDRLHRLVKMVEPGPWPTTYRYDAVGNLVEEVEGSVTWTYYYDEDDRLTEKWGLGSLAIRYSYDSNGNMIRTWVPRPETTTYTYDSENRLTSKSSCTYTYAATGERMSSTCSATKYFGYDFAAQGGLADVIAEYDSSGTRVVRYTHGPGADEPVGMLRSGAHYTYQKDGLGSVTRITDASQGTAISYAYSPWGVTTPSATFENPFQYTGREMASDFYHYRARAYDPGARRFLQKDPAGMVDGTNRYAYVGNNPVNRQDPTGLGCWPWDIPCIIRCETCKLVTSAFLGFVVGIASVSACLAVASGFCLMIALVGGFLLGGAIFTFCMIVIGLECSFITLLAFHYAASYYCKLVRKC